MAIHNGRIFESKPELLQGNVQIIACAGSGKTEFVSERIAFQIASGIAKPSEIVALTFNDAAAEELKFRVRDKIKELLGKQPDIGDMYIGTIHAFSFMILQEFLPEYRSYDMLDENSRKAFAVSIKYDLQLPGLYRSLKNRGYQYNKFFAINNPQLWQSWTLNSFLSDVDFYREESITDDCIVSNTFRQSIQVYLNKLKERRFLDFSGILRLAVDKLEEDAYALGKLRERYKFFTIDEYQDVNPIQERLIRLVSGQENVCVVGDDDQSIYQWRGADVSNIRDFEHNYPGVNIHKLEMNRRSHNRIVECAAGFISINPQRLDKAIIANDTQTEDGDLYKIAFGKQEDEIQWIVDKIQSLYGTKYIDKGNPRKLMYSDMVLLFRNRSDAAHYKHALEEANINVVYSGMGGLMEAPEVAAILRVLRYIGESVKNDDNDPNDSLTDIHAAITETFDIDFKDFKAVIKDTIVWCEAQKRLSFQGLYYKLLSAFGLDALTFHNDSSDDVVLYNLGRFSQAISDYEGSRTYLSKNDILRFVEYIDTFVSNAYDEGSTNANEGLIDAIKIMTLHGTKGLGFPVVFMPSMISHRGGQGRVTFLDDSKIDFARYAGSEVDERRLYYVALTRAKKYLFLTTPGIKIGNTRRTAACSFWNEIDDRFFICQPTPDPTVREQCDIIRFDSDVRFPTNYSELSYYMSCSYDYKMRFIYGFNPELVQALGYGKQVHNLINLLHKEYEKNKVVPNAEKIAELVEANFYMRYAAEKQTEILKKSCTNSLNNYLSLFKDDFSLAVKTEQAFEMDFDNKALIAGSIDLLSRANGDESVLEVIDFKTGKQQSQFEEKYAHQVVLYTIAAREVLQRNVEKAYLHYIDASADATKRVEVDVSDAKIKETRDLLNNGIDGIISNQFPRIAEKHNCGKCDWNQICPKTM